ncbi:MAG: hypothetical protein H7338_23410 [Candidatus Sericytochromatia bacterium]|nr:hypothetical protein [Candidatus Sericytochromatia bacterium]
MTEQTPPPVQSIERGGCYETNAGLKIIIRISGTTDIYKNGVLITPASLGANNPITTSTFHKFRETEDGQHDEHRYVHAASGQTGASQSDDRCHEVGRPGRRQPRRHDTGQQSGAERHQAD